MKTWAVTEGLGVCRWPAVRVWYLCLEGGQSSRKRSGDLPVKAEACHLIIRDPLGQELKLGGTFRISALSLETKAEEEAMGV